jgi:hypothetical protein
MTQQCRTRSQKNAAEPKWHGLQPVVSMAFQAMSYAPSVPSGLASNHTIKRFELQ